MVVAVLLEGTGHAQRTLERWHGPALGGAPDRKALQKLSQSACREPPLPNTANAPCRYRSRQGTQASRPDGAVVHSPNAASTSSCGVRRLDDPTASIMHESREVGPRKMPRFAGIGCKRYAGQEASIGYEERVRARSSSQPG
jgi:hypothetical protein